MPTLTDAITEPLVESGKDGYWGASEELAKLADKLNSAIEAHEDTAHIVTDIDEELYCERAPTPDEMDFDEDAYWDAQYARMEAEATAEAEFTDAELDCGVAATQKLLDAQHDGIGPDQYPGTQAYADAVEEHRQAAYEEAYDAVETAYAAGDAVREAQQRDADEETHDSALALEEAEDTYADLTVDAAAVVNDATTEVSTRTDTHHDEDSL